MLKFLYPLTQWDIPKDINLHISSYLTTLCVLIVHTLSAQFKILQQKGVIRLWKLPVRYCSHRSFLCNSLSCSEIVVFISSNLPLSVLWTSCIFLFGRTCFEVEGVWQTSLRGGWMTLICRGYVFIRTLRIIRLRMGTMVSRAEGQCANMSNSSREPARSDINWYLVPGFRTRQEA
jgi:hypothetical protein